MFEKSLRSDQVSPRSDEYSPRIHYSSESMMNQTHEYPLNSSTPRWNFGISNVNQPRINGPQNINDYSSDDEFCHSSDDQYPRSSGEYARKIRQSKRSLDPVVISRSNTQRKDVLRKSTKHSKEKSLPDLIPEWRDKVLSEKFKKDYFYKLKRLPVRLSSRLSRNRDSKHSQITESLKKSSVPELIIYKGGQSAPIKSRRWLWFLFFILSLIFVFGAASVPLILRLTQEKETSYVRYSLRLSTNKTYIEEYNTISSVPYTNITQRFCSELDNCYRSSNNGYKDVYHGCFVTALGKGPSSTVVYFDIFFKSSTMNEDKVFSALVNCIDTSRNSFYGHLGDFTIAMSSIEKVSVKYGISKPAIISTPLHDEMVTTSVLDIQTSIVTSYGSTTDEMITTGSINHIIDTLEMKHTTDSMVNDSTYTNVLGHVTSFSTTLNQEQTSPYLASTTETYNTESRVAGRSSKIVPTSSLSINNGSESQIESPSGTMQMTTIAKSNSINAETGTSDRSTEVTSTSAAFFTGSYNADNRHSSGSTDTLILETTESGTNEKLVPTPTLGISVSVSADNDQTSLEQTMTSVLQS